MRWPLILLLLAILVLAGTCHLQSGPDPVVAPIAVQPVNRLQPEPDFESKVETIATGVSFAMPVKRGEAMKLTPVAPVTGDPKAALTTMLRAEECAAPVVIEWRHQWRGDCLTPLNRRIRIALVKGSTGWAGLRIDYADVNNLGMAPFAKQILDSGKAAQ